MAEVDGHDEVVSRMAMLWRELRRGASTAVVRDRMFGIDADGVEPGHMDLLDLLEAESPRRMNDLAEALRVDPSTVTRAVQRMEADGLVGRMPSPDDGRGVVVTATEDGRRRWAAVADRRVHIVHEIMDPLDEDEQRRLVELLGRFVTSLHGYVNEGALAASSGGAAHGGQASGAGRG